MPSSTHAATSIGAGGPFLCRSRSAIPLDVQIDERLRDIVHEFGIQPCRMSFDRILREFGEAPSITSHSNHEKPSPQPQQPVLYQSPTHIVHPLHQQQEEAAASRASSANNSCASSSSENDTNEMPNNDKAVSSSVRKSSTTWTIDEKQLKEYRLKSAMLDVSFDSMICTDEDGIIVAINKAAMLQFGFNHTAVQLVGQSVKILVEKDTLELMYDEDMIGKRREIQVKRRNGVEFPAIFGMEVIEMADGEPVNNNHEKANHTSGNNDSDDEENNELFFLSIRDVTYEQMARNMLAEQYSVQEKTKSAIIEASFDPMFAADTTGTITMVNKATVKTFGYTTTAEMIGQNVKMLVGGSNGEAEQHDNYIQTFLKTRERRVAGQQRQVTARRKDGTEFPVLIGMEFVEPANATPLFVAFIRDITEELKQQKALKEQEGVLQTYQQQVVMLQKLQLDQHKQLQDALAREEQQQKDGAEFSKQRQFPQVEVMNQTLGIETPLPPSVGEHGGVALEMMEQRAAKELLANMIPSEIAVRVDQTALHEAPLEENYASLLFADVVGYNDLKSTFYEDELTQNLSDLFARFDDLVEKYGLYKIKTTEDCYMVASVFVRPEVNKEMCAAVCHFAFDMLAALVSHNGDYYDCPINLRISIDTGPIAVPGVNPTVPNRFFFHELWGDAADLASRMESMGIPDRIQVTQSVVEMVPEGEFQLDPRETVEVKGKGRLKTFYLKERLRSPARRFIRSKSMFFV